MDFASIVSRARWLVAAAVLAFAAGKIGIIELAVAHRGARRGLLARVLGAHPVSDEHGNACDEVVQAHFFGPSPIEHDSDFAARMVDGPLGELAQRAALDLLVGLGELATHGGATLGPEDGGGIGKRVREAVRGLKEDDGARLRAQGLEPGPARALLARGKGVEDKMPDTETGQGEGRGGG